MSYISKVFFLCLIIFIFSFLSLLAGQPVSDIFGFSQDELSRGSEVLVHNSTNASVSRAEQKVLEAIIDDFPVNNDTTGGCEQSYPAIAEEHPEVLLSPGMITAVPSPIYMRRDMTPPAHP